MLNTGRDVCRMMAVAGALLASSATASAQDVIIAGYAPPAVAYYQPAVMAYRAPVVAYRAPVVAYSVPVVSYTPRVAYYAAPTASYYPGAVQTTRYGVLGHPRRSTTYYPGVVLP